MSHPTNLDILERQREDLEFWQQKHEVCKEEHNYSGIEICKQKIRKILDAGHRIEGYTTTK